MHSALSLTNPWTRGILVTFIAALFAVTNLPWTLDDYDQAKQAYTSFEMVRQGHWLYQHTPNEGVATKPPLVGWISAGLFETTKWWEGAWRIPSFAAALALFWLIAREANAAFGPESGSFAAAAFGLNLLAPRLATLVRTDMPLALAIFLIGLQIWRKIRRAEKWRTRDRTHAFVLLTISMLIKGPIVLAFILPGLVTYQILRRRAAAPSAWSGWWPWLFALGIFLVWTIGGIVRQPNFYDSVVLKEFAGRFTETIHKPQPIYFYLPHLLHKFAPWSLLIIALAILFRRRRLKISSATLWLVCWSAGGLALMSLIPSKRVDRIFPVVPPLCLLLGAQLAAAREISWKRNELERWLKVALVFALVFSSGYAAWKIGSRTHHHAASLVRFARSVRHTVEEQHWRYAVCGGGEEGLLLYLRRDHFLSPNEAAAQWKNGALDALVVPSRPSPGWVAALPGARELLLSEKSAVVPGYTLLVPSP